MRRRTLSLKRETLSELTAADLTHVVGAAESGIKCTTDYLEAVSDNLSCPSCRCTRTCTI